MKKIILVLLMGASVALANGQDNAISSYFSDYQNDENFTKVSVTGKMFSLFTELDTEDEDEKAILEAISKLDGIKGLIKQNAENGNKMYADAVKKMSADGKYEELMTIEDVKENVRFMIRDEGGKISELLMVRGAEREFMLMTLFGDIDLSTISKISKVMRVHGFDKFGMLGGEHHHEQHKEKN